MSTQIQNILEIRAVSKSFSGVEVLHSVDLDLAPGKVHAVVGENGAGKSTLIKILSGVYRRDAGAITIEGRLVDTLSPHIAQSLGIVTIYQERNLIPYLSVGENILLGNVPTSRLGAVQWKRLYERAGEILANLNLKLDPRKTVVNLSPAEQQAVEIAKALYKKARIVIMDEPTASLTAAETENLFDLICQLRGRDVAVIYISHRLDEIFQIADEVTVLRDGYKVLNCPISQVTKEELVKAMVGEEITVTFIAESSGAGELLLDVQGLTRAGVFEDVSLKLKRGMIIGLAGALGSGRTNVLRALGGIEPVTGGKIILDGTELQGKGLTEIIERGICFVPAERDEAGLILSMSLAGNTTIANLGAVTRGPFMDLARERTIAQKAIRDLDIQAKSIHQEVRYLSGGNRQKVMLSKWLARGLEVFLLDEPTQGVDVGAHEEIHQIMKRLLEQGKGILMVTSDLDELMNMSQCIAVMNRGRLVAYLDAKHTTREEVLSYAIGSLPRELTAAQRFKRVFESQQLGIVFVLIGLIIILGIVSPVFLSPRNLRNVLQQVSTLGILAMGTTVLMVSGGIDLSIGSCISVVAVVIGMMIKAQLPPELAILVGLLIGCSIGLVNGLLAAYTRAHPFILTLGTMTFFSGVAVYITKGFPITDLGKRYEWIGSAQVWQIPVIVIFFFLVMAICHVLLRYTRTGRIAYAIGGNEYTTYLAGVPVRRYKILFYVISGFFAGLAAIVLSSRISSAIPTMGADYTLQAIGAVVIGGVPLTGGRGNVWGTLTGVLLLGVIANGLNLLHFDASIQYMLTGMIIVVAVILHEQRSRR